MSLHILKSSFIRYRRNHGISRQMQLILLLRKIHQKSLALCLEKVLSLVREGYAYREIAVVAGDLSVYRDEIFTCILIRQAFLFLSIRKKD